MSPANPDEELTVAADCTLDAFGLVCPLPIIKTSQKLQEMEPGQVLEVIADDEMIIEDMPAWCQVTGNVFLGYKEEEGELKVYVRKEATKPSR